MRLLLGMQIIIFTLCSCLLASAVEPVRTTTETLLAVWERPELERIVPPDGTGETYRRNYAFFRCSPDGQMFTYLQREAARERLVVNGKPEPWFDALLGGAVFTPDGRLMYAARTGKRYVVVTDGQASPEYDLLKTIAASPWRPRTVEVMDRLWQEDESARGFDRAYDANLTFTPPGTGRVLYIARRDGQDRLVIDGQEVAAYDTIGRIACSPDGARLALAVKADGKWRVVLDWRLLPEAYDELATARGESAFAFSLDGKRFAFQASAAGKSLLIIDGAVHAKDEPGLGALLDAFPRRTFGSLYYKVNKDSVLIEGYPRVNEYVSMGEETALACLVRDGKQERLWMNGILSNPYDDISTHYWCPFAGGIACVVKEGEKEFVLAKWVEGARYDKILALKASPDGKHLAYAARRGEAYTVVLDGNESNPQPKIDEFSLAFSPDGSHFTFRILYENGSSVVVDGKPSPIYRLTFSPAFGPAGECAFVADERRGQQAVVDGISGLFYERIFDFRVFFDGPGRYHYFTRRGQRIYRVDEAVQHPKT